MSRPLTGLAESALRTRSSRRVPRGADAAVFAVVRPERALQRREFGRHFGRTRELSTYVQVDGSRPSVCMSDVEMELLGSNAPSAGLCRYGSLDQTNQKRGHS